MDSPVLGERHGIFSRRPDITLACRVAVIPVVIGFGVIAVVAGGATLLLPAIKEAVVRSQKRRRSKNRKKRPRTPHQRIDLSAPLPGKAEGTPRPDPTPNTG